MADNIQKLSIRLLKLGLEPGDTLRGGVELMDWATIEGAKIALDTMGGSAPKWSRFLGLSEEEKAKVYNHTAYGLVFINTSGRWFAISFGMGHVKLDSAAFEQDFGLRVVLNSVDPEQLKSADVRTPDENTLSRRSQTSRGSDQTAFSIDVERDIIRGLAGTPKDKEFAIRVAGTDALSIDRRMEVSDLAQVCDDTLAMYGKEEYKEHFGWVDQIRHVREGGLLEDLNEAAAAKLDAILKGADADGVHLAFPVIYDPEKGANIRYKGFRSKLMYPDLDLSGYLDALKEREVKSYTKDCLDGHRVHEVDDDGKDCGSSWKVSDCLVMEIGLDGSTYVMSGGRWYQVDHDLASQVQKFFEDMPRDLLPDALVDENEETYNARMKATQADLLCLDRKLITPSGWSTTMETCDFLGSDSRLIHVKDKTSSSRLSHLFNQGTVSARVLIIDSAARDLVRAKIAEVQAETSQTGFEELVPGAGGDFRSSDYKVVYAVIGAGDHPKLPFFSMVTLRQAVRELQALGYKSSFAWIAKPKAAGKKAKAAAVGHHETADDGTQDDEGGAE